MATLSKLLKIILLSPIIISHSFSPASAANVTVCPLGCTYSTLQTAIENTTDTDIIQITQNLYGSSAQANLSIPNYHNISIQCLNNVSLDAAGSSTLISGGLPRKVSFSNCAFKGATNYLIDINPTSSHFIHNTFISTRQYPGKVKVDFTTTFDQNLFTKSTLTHVIGAATITNNAFTTSTSSFTALNLNPTQPSVILHNSIRGYNTGINLSGYTTFTIANNLLSTLATGYNIASGTTANTHNTLAHQITTLRNGPPNSGHDYAVISGNPYFIDSQLRINPRSAAHNTGHQTLTLEYDRDNNKRRDNLPDIGAYEIQ